MSGRNTTIQDDDPTFITYSAGWVYNNSDPQYGASNYHATTRLGATVTIKFEGNGIEVTGARKPEYGSYSVELDGRPRTNHSAFSPAQVFRQPLFSLQGLPDGPHSIRIINRGPGFDVDTFTFITTPPKTAPSDTNPTGMIIGAVLAAIGVFALIIILILLRRLLRYKREKKRLYGGASSETLVQAHPYDYTPPGDPVNQRSKYSDQDLPNIPAPAFMGSPVSVQVHLSSTRSKSPAIGGSDHSQTSLPYLANDAGRYRSTSQSSIGSMYSVNLAQRPPVTHSTPSVYVPEAPPRPASVSPVSIRSASVGTASIRPSVRPLSIAGRPGSIRPTGPPESPFDSRRVCSFYPTQPTIREYNKRDTIFGKRSIDERGRVDLLADDVPGTAPAHKTEFSSPRPAPCPPAPASISSLPPPPQSIPDSNGPPRLTLNTTMMSSINEPALSIEWSPSLSTMRFATRPNSGVTQPPSTTPSRSNSKGESLFSPSEKERRSSTGSKSQREWRRSSLIPSVPPLPSLPEPEPELDPIALAPLAPPPPVTTRHQRGAGSLGSMSSVTRVAIGTPNSTIFNFPAMKNKPFASVGLPGSPRPLRALSPPQSLSQSPQLPPFALGTNAGASPRALGMRVVDLEAGVVGIIEEKRAWARVRSMMGVVGDTNKDEALFELVAGTPPPLPSPAPRQGQGAGWQGQMQWQGQKQRLGRAPGPREALPGRVGGPRVLKKPAPLVLGGLSNFAPPVYGSGNGVVPKRFVREDVVATGKTSTPTAAAAFAFAFDSDSGRKKMSILQSAVINGRANKEEVELVTGMKMDI